MKKFSFRLEALIKYRQYKELHARQEVARTYRDLNECELVVHSLEQKLSQTAELLDRITAEGISVVEFKNYQVYLDGISDDLTRQSTRKKSLERLLGEKQTLLTRASVDRQVLDRLKAKKKAEYMLQFQKLEQNASDEIASLKKAREIINGNH
ncbi:MAG: flagellar export protein FliJ [Desulfobacterium sp.]|jgi:flagellar FliJ protein|nr:flagellar export protein FliJ [Desulfobacterium sp.]